MIWEKAGGKRITDFPDADLALDDDFLSADAAWKRYFEPSLTSAGYTDEMKKELRNKFEHPEKILVETKSDGATSVLGNSK